MSLECRRAGTGNPKAGTDVVRSGCIKSGEADPLGER